MKRKSIFLDMVSRRIKNEPFTMEQLEIDQEGKRLNAACNIKSPVVGKNGFSISPFFKSEEEQWLQGRNVRDIETIENQQYFIQGQNHYLINSITETSVFIKAGAMFFPLEMETAKIPELNGILAQWLDDETEPVSDGSEISPEGATLSCKGRLYVCLDIPRKMIDQGGPEADLYIRSAITAALANKLDATIGGVLAAGTSKFQGMGYAITTGNTSKSNAIIPTYDNLVNLEKSLEGLNFPVENMAFITNAAGRRILRKLYIGDAGTDPAFKDGKILDYPAYISNFVSSAAGSAGDGNLLLFGNWKDLIICQFGSYDILVDPYILKNKGKLQLTVNSYFDVKGLRGSVVTSVNDSTEPNHYAHSFAALAIK